MFPTNQADFRALFESAPGLYLALAPDFRIIAVSNAYLAATMTERDAILGRGIWEIFPDDPGDSTATGQRNLRASLEYVRQLGKADTMSIQRYPIRRPESQGGGFEERHWSPRNYPVIAPDGRLVAIIHCVEDVTDLVRLKKEGETELSLRTEEVAEANLRLKVANASLAKLYEQIAELMITLDDELRHEEAVDLQMINQPRDPGQMLTRIGRLIADHKNVSERLRDSQRLDSIGRLAGGVAHDFNNLLTVINGYSKLVLKSLEPGTQLYDDIRQIAESGREAAELTKRLLAFGRKQVLRPVVLDLNQVIRESLKILGQVVGEDIRLITRFSQEPPLVRADPVQMNQVLLNLLTNARDAMPLGGSVTIETCLVTINGEPAVSPPELPGGTYIECKITDTGIGMDEDIQRCVFEPFFTTKEHSGGTGLGLATVYGIIRQSGGSIQLESVPGQGTTFRIYLPFAAESVEPYVQIQDAPGKTGPAPSRGLLVLVVEDQVDVRHFVARILRDHGYRVLQATSGKEALSIVQHPRTNLDLLLADVVMPGMSGVDLWYGACTARPDKETRVLFMSGYTEGKVGATVPKGVALIEKPFAPDDLLRAVAEVLSSPALTPAGSISDPASPPMNFQA